MPRWLHDDHPAPWYDALRRRLVRLGLFLEILAIASLGGLLR